MSVMWMQKLDNSGDSYAELNGQELSQDSPHRRAINQLMDEASEGKNVFSNEQVKLVRKDNLFLLKVLGEEKDVDGRSNYLVYLDSVSPSVVNGAVSKIQSLARKNNRTISTSTLNVVKEALSKLK